MRRIVCLLFCLILPLYILCFSPEASAVNGAKASILIEASTMQVLSSSNAEQKLPMASVTKVMSLLLWAEMIEAGTLTLEETVKATSAVQEIDGSVIWLEPGDEMTAAQLLESVIIASANDAACALAEFVSGSETAFVDLMNQTAQRLGMTNTHFMNPHGLHHENHYTTARDLATLTYEAMKNETFRGIVCQVQGTLPKNSQRNLAYKYKTTNRLKRHGNTPGYMTDYMDDILGIKTGSTSAAGLNFACCMKKDDLLFYSVVMHAGEVEYEGNTVSGHFTDTVKLLDYARTYLGTPYSYGGSSYSGTDCSGFTMRCFDYVGYSLSHGARDQYRRATPVTTAQRDVGDLVFFSGPGSDLIEHVGIYLGGGRFIHASSSEGVTIDSVYASYYADYYYGAARIIFE